MKLWVDDLRKAPDVTWTIVRTNTEAIRLLAMGYVEEISIDHDICTPFSGDISKSVRRRLMIGQETFQPVAYYMVAMNPEFRPKIITFHTANVTAGQSMIKLLKDAGIESTYKQSSYVIDLGENEL